jgi:hypothetical protein
MAPSAGEKAMLHLMKEHGMHSVPCPQCGGKTPECDTCKGEGVLIAIDRREACGPACPIALGLFEGKFSK